MKNKKPQEKAIIPPSKYFVHEEQKSFKKVTELEFIIIEVILNHHYKGVFII